MVVDQDLIEHSPKSHHKMALNIHIHLPLKYSHFNTTMECFFF